MLYAALKSRSSTLVAGAKGVIRNDHYAKLDPAQVSVLHLSLQDPTRGRAAIHGRVKRD
jgi:hypothetical protein